MEIERGKNYFGCLNIGYVPNLDYLVSGIQMVGLIRKLILLFE